MIRLSRVLCMTVNTIDHSQHGIYMILAIHTSDHDHQHFSSVSQVSDLSVEGGGGGVGTYKYNTKS